MSAPDDAATPADDDLAWLPPDQVPTRKWPVVGEKQPLAEALDPATWSLRIEGAVAHPQTFDAAAVAAWPAEAFTLDVHCVTRWSRRAMTFEGRRLAELLDAAQPTPAACTVRFVAWSARDHDTTLPLAEALARCWLVHRAEGAPLPVSHGGPLRVVTEGRYFYKSLKWVRRIEILTEHRLGYWEREDGYHDGADPWPGDQRYLSGSLKPAARERFLAATDLAPWRTTTLRRVDLAGWRPASRDLRDLKLKGCDLRGAQLAGCDLRGINLSLSDLRGADLRGADLRGADLEGAWLQGADLRQADLSAAALTATTFVADGQGARLEGAVLRDATGLLEDQADYVSRASQGPAHQDDTP